MGLVDLAIAIAMAIMAGLAVDESEPDHACHDAANRNSELDGGKLAAAPSSSDAGDYTSSVCRMTSVFWALSISVLHVSASPSYVHVRRTDLARRQGPFPWHAAPSAWLLGVRWDLTGSSSACPRLSGFTGDISPSTESERRAPSTITDLQTREALR
jgi:hypothetical protein